MSPIMTEQPRSLIKSISTLKMALTTIYFHNNDIITVTVLIIPNYYIYITSSISPIYSKNLTDIIKRDNEQNEEK